MDYEFKHEKQIIGQTITHMFSGLFNDEYEEYMNINNKKQPPYFICMAVVSCSQDGTEHVHVELFHEIYFIIT